MALSIRLKSGPFHPTLNGPSRPTLTEEMKKQKDASMKTYDELNADARKLEKLTETLEHYLERENRNRTKTDGNDTLS